MDDKEKNAEVAKAIKLPDLASYMQVVIKQLEIDKKFCLCRSAYTFNHSVKWEPVAAISVCTDRIYSKLCSIRSTDRIIP